MVARGGGRRGGRGGARGGAAADGGGGVIPPQPGADGNAGAQGPHPPPAAPAQGAGAAPGGGAAGGQNPQAQPAGAPAAQPPPQQGAPANAAGNNAAGAAAGAPQNPAQPAPSPADELRRRFLHDFWKQVPYFVPKAPMPSGTVRPDFPSWLIAFENYVVPFNLDPRAYRYALEISLQAVLRNVDANHVAQLSDIELKRFAARQANSNIDPGFIANLPQAQGEGLLEFIDRIRLLSDLLEQPLPLRYLFEIVSKALRPEFAHVRQAWINFNNSLELAGGAAAPGAAAQPAAAPAVVGGAGGAAGAAAQFPDSWDAFKTMLAKFDRTYTVNTPGRLRTTPVHLIEDDEPEELTEVNAMFSNRYYDRPPKRPSFGESLKADLQSTIKQEISSLRSSFENQINDVKREVGREIKRLEEEIKHRSNPFPRRGRGGKFRWEEPRQQRKDHNYKKRKGDAEPEDSPANKMPATDSNKSGEGK
eukprot:TRINITY_DN800_c0_g5_i1.p2 TRINITY_DN800_c0_g5~~TRINITY_DN800_c0_g5_i1.p2  ORF type:complete len:476 (+),score=109.78 TRINITY_DN800_c0_g5_i1:2322-3749(+)